MLFSDGKHSIFLNHQLRLLHHRPATPLSTNQVRDLSWPSRASEPLRSQIGNVLLSAVLWHNKFLMRSKHLLGVSFPALEYRHLFPTPPSAARLHRLQHGSPSRPRASTSRTFWIDLMTTPITALRVQTTSYVTTSMTSKKRLSGI